MLRAIRNVAQHFKILQCIAQMHLLQALYGFVQCFEDLCESRNAYHFEYFFKVIRETCDRDVLVVSFRFCEDLDEYGDATAVNVGILLKYQHYFFFVFLDQTII